jgi:tRNA(Ile)-lysidine synthase
MSLLEQFKAHIASHCLFGREDLLILAVSGGSDSMVLTDLCKRSGFDFVLAHCNFQLRGEESLRDQQFVKEYAERNNIPFYTVSFDTLEYISINKLSIQEGARQIRYKWLNELADKLANEKRQQTYILTAHHADDQIETLMMHFFRGTGLKGLTGIPEKNGRVIRSLLGFTKKELLAYLEENNIQFVEDKSNLTSDYTRNFFRNEIIPAIEKVYPSVKENLLDNIQRFKSTDSLYRKILAPLLYKIVKQKGNEKLISIQTLLNYNSDTLIYELIHPYGFSERQIEELKKLSNAISGSFIEAANTHYRIIKHRNHFVIAPPASKDAGIILIEETDKNVFYESGMMQLEMKEDKPSVISTDINIALLDTKNIRFPLLLRKWKEGDYFYPLGMRKKKKIARFLIDQKLSKTEKEKVCVLESDNRIIWVVGHRIDDRFKITSSTKNTLIIKNRMRDLSDKMLQ